MKYFVLSSLLLFSLSTWSQEYSENDGYSAPGTIDDAKSKGGESQVKKKISTTETTVIEKEEAPIEGSGQIGTDAMNTAPNPPPETQGDVLDDSTLTGPFNNLDDPQSQNPAEIEAQQEDALDYSTTPEKRTTRPLGPNKK